MPPSGRITRFPARADGAGERLSGFMAHLRLNGLKAGPQETALALDALAAVNAADPAEARLALKALLATSPERWAAFDTLFDAYWFAGGRERTRPADRPRQSSRPALWDGPPRSGTPGARSTEEGDAPGGGAGEGEATGRLAGSRTEARQSRDLRAPDDLKEAARIADRLAHALRGRPSHRRRPAGKGDLDLRRILRRSLARGGEPIDLPRRRRKVRPVRIAALLDVSGSMDLTTRPFLAFLKGLAATGLLASAHLVHTRLAPVTEALRDADGLRAAARLALMAEGIGGGTRLGTALRTFNDGAARRSVTGRTIVLLISDGYDTDPPEALAREMARLARRARRILWLNPLHGAEPPRALAAALPHVDAHLPARHLADLAALEGEFRRLRP